LLTHPFVTECCNPGAVQELVSDINAGKKISRAQNGRGGGGGSSASTFQLNRNFCNL
jgi:hypothetical protein